MKVKLIEDAGSAEEDDLLDGCVERLVERGSREEARPRIGFPGLPVATVASRRCS